MSLGRLPIPIRFSYNMWSSKAPPTWESASHLTDAEVDKLLEEGRAETDAEKRKAIYEAADARIVAVAPAIFASEFSSIFVGRDNFKLPPFEDESQRFSAEEYGLQFRMIEMGK